MYICISHFMSKFVFTIFFYILIGIVIINIFFYILNVYFKCKHEMLIFTLQIKMNLKIVNTRVFTRCMWIIYFDCESCSLYKVMTSIIVHKHLCMGTNNDCSDSAWPAHHCPSFPATSRWKKAVQQRWLFRTVSP